MPPAARDRPSDARDRHGKDGGDVDDAAGGTHRPPLPRTRGSLPTASGDLPEI